MARRLRTIVGMTTSAVILSVFGCQTGEPWTILCLKVENPDHRAAVDGVAEALKTAPGIAPSKLHVRHGDESSSLYYGTYYRTIDRGSKVREIPAALREDMALVQQLVDDHGRRIFMGARMVREPLAEVGPAEWDLNNADGVYSLQVAAFEASPTQPDFRKAAVDATSTLRAQGYEAYFHHGPSSSVVTVGRYGADAVITRDGVVGYSQAVRELQQKENFKYNLTNGAIWYAVVDGQKAPVRSLLVKIPEKDGFSP